MTASDAWLLELDDSLAIAIGDHEMVEYVRATTTFPVPGAPKYCSHVFLWQNKLVPIMDVSMMRGHTNKRASDGFMGLVAYQLKPGAPIMHIALYVNELPKKIQVDDEQVCELPEELDDGLVRQLCLSCFKHESQPVVIIDIARLCSAETGETLNVSVDFNPQLQEAITPVVL